MKTLLIVTLALAASASAFAEDNELITGFTASQDLSTRLVSADFTLTTNAIVIVDVCTNIAPGSAETASIGAENFQSLHDYAWNPTEFPGNRVLPKGNYKFRWMPMKDWPGRRLANTVSIHVRAYRLASPPAFMVVDLDGSQTKRFYETLADIPEGGVTNEIYKTDKLVMSRIPATGVTWRMGNPSETTNNAVATPHYVTLTNDYYIGIYEFTGAQLAKIGKSTQYTGDTTLPAWRVKYTNLRGGDWPDQLHDGVGDGTVMAVMRTKTGLKFDLPTEAEFEFAQRAGEGGDYWYTPITDAELAFAKEIKEVGSTGICNRWGLYDMAGNVKEIVVDQYGTFTSDAVIAPVGATGTTTCVLRGADYKYSTEVNNLVSWRRVSQSRTTDNCGSSRYFGFRMACPAEIPEE